MLQLLGPLLDLLVKPAHLLGRRRWLRLVEEEDDGRPGRKKWEAAVADLSRRRVEGEERSRGGGYKSSRRVVWCGRELGADL